MSEVAPQMSASDFNPHNLISDVINFGILSAEEFMIIERPYYYRNRNNPYSTSSRQGQPLYRIPHAILPILVPQIMFSIDIRQGHNFVQFTHRYVQLPPIWACQIARPMTAPNVSTLQIREIAPAPVSPIIQPVSGGHIPNTELAIAEPATPDFEVVIKEEDIKDVKNNIIKTPYQGSRRSFGRFLCDKCSRDWQSANTWANMWQMCFRCLGRVYPSWQASHYASNLQVYRPYSNSIKQLTEFSAYVYKEHPQEYCGMCQHLGQNCRFLDFIPSK